MRHFDLEGALDIRSVPEIARQLLDHFQSGMGVLIATDRLEAVDASVVQLLLAARRQAAEAGVSIGLAEPIADALQRIVPEIGLDDPRGASGAADCTFLTVPLQAEVRDSR